MASESMDHEAEGALLSDRLEQAKVSRNEKFFFFAFYGNKEKLFAFLELYLLVIYSIVTCLSKFNSCDLF